jgi:hypothetical protein
VIPDNDITEARLKAVRELRWPIPALVIVGMTHEDLDLLAVASDRNAYWHVLNTVVTRIEARSATVDRPSEETA